MKKTPLYDNHVRLGGKMIDFGGWQLPVQYTGIIEEHDGVRSAAGLFDVSHMGEITVKGAGADSFIQYMVTNDMSKATDGQAVYSPMCYPDGGVVDDLLIYRIGAGDYLLIVNAANTDKDLDWLKQHVADGVDIENASDRYAQLAIQGPNAEKILQRLCDIPLEEIKFFHFRSHVKVGGADAIVSRTGYTGEDGFELYLPSEDAAGLWDDLLREGQEDGLVPVGLGARDTLRFEVALPLYGHELSADISPLEAGLGMFVKPGKGAFIGRDALSAQKEAGAKRKLVGFEVTGRGIPRNGFDVQADGKSVGFVTTGSFAPTLKKTLGLALIDATYAAEGTVINVMVRNRPVEAKIVKKPFYTKKYKK